MERDHIVELIKDGRLQEAITALDQATLNTHLHNDLVTVSAAYADYVKQNRSATEDFQTMNIQRSKITNSLLSILDELTPEVLAALERDSSYTVTSVSYEYQKNFSSKASKFIALVIGVIFAIGSIFSMVFSCNDADNTITAMDNVSPNAITEPVINDDITTGVSLVEFKMKGGAIGKFSKEGDNWLENNKFTFVEDKRAEGVIYLQDNKRGHSIQLDLMNKHIRRSTKQESTFKIVYYIEYFE
jgi:Effector-associated domain 11